MNKSTSILLVEDELTLAMIIKDTLEAEGFQTIHAKNGAEGLKLFYEFNPDLLVADVMMPQMDGFELVKQVRKSNTHTPVLFLTARSAIKDIVEGFEIGANDYLKKPFNIQELIVRIKALTNNLFTKPKEPEAERFQIGVYTFDPILQKLTCSKKEQELSHRESEILKRLCMNQNEVINMQTVLIELWGDDNFFNSRSLHVFITKLRHKLSDDPSIRIVNVRGVGYKLIVEN